MLCILFLLRWLLRPYQKLVGEAERASVSAQTLKSQDEAEFVLETFQSVVSQLQEQRKELEQLSAEARERASSAEKFSERIVASLPSGLIAFDADVAIGWCQLTSREALPWLDHRWKPVDEVSVWSISCFYVRKGYRRRGVTFALIHAAVKAAKKAGAQALEAYPLDAKLSPSASGTGYVSTFARAGFKTVAHRTASRPIMRLKLRTS